MPPGRSWTEIGDYDKILYSPAGGFQMQIAELCEALGNVAAGTLDTVTAAQFAYFESRKLAQTVSDSYFTRLLVDARELGTLRSECDRLRSVVKEDQHPSPCEMKADADYQTLLSIHTSRWHRLFTTRGRLHKEDQWLSYLENEIGSARASRAAHLSLAANEHAECAAKEKTVMVALAETEEWRLWELDRKTRVWNGYEFASHLEAQYKPHGEAHTRIMPMGLTTLEAVGSLSRQLEATWLGSLRAQDADPLIELVHAVELEWARSQLMNWTHLKWRDARGVVDALTQMQTYRSSGVEYEVHYTPPDLDRDGEEWETPEGVITVYRHKDESVRIVPKGCQMADHLTA